MISRCFLWDWINYDKLHAFMTHFLEKIHEKLMASAQWSGDKLLVAAKDGCSLRFLSPAFLDLDDEDVCRAVTEMDKGINLRSLRAASCSQDY